MQIFLVFRICNLNLFYFIKNLCYSDKYCCRFCSCSTVFRRKISVAANHYGFCQAPIKQRLQHNQICFPYLYIAPIASLIYPIVYTLHIYIKSLPSVHGIYQYPEQTPYRIYRLLFRLNKPMQCFFHTMNLIQRRQTYYLRFQYIQIKA